MVRQGEPLIAGLTKKKGLPKKDEVFFWEEEQASERASRGSGEQEARFATKG